MSSDNAQERSAVKQALLAVEKMKARLTAITQERSEPLAIIGMACHFPGGAHTPDDFWHVLKDGVDTIAQVPADRWDLDAFYDPDPQADGKMSTR